MIDFISSQSDRDNNSEQKKHKNYRFTLEEDTLGSVVVPFVSLLRATWRNKEDKYIAYWKTI